MTECPWRMFKLSFCRNLTYRRILYRDEQEYEECCSEYRHCYIEHEIDVCHLCACRNSSDECTNKHWSECARERVQSTSNEVELITTVAAATKQVEHRVHHGVEQTNRESGYESSQEIDVEACQSRTHT